MVGVHHLLHHRHTLFAVCRLRYGAVCVLLPCAAQGVNGAVGRRLHIVLECSLGVPCGETEVTLGRCHLLVVDVSVWILLLQLHHLCANILCQQLLHVVAGRAHHP